MTRRRSPLLHPAALAAIALSGLAGGCATTAARQSQDRPPPSADSQSDSQAVQQAGQANVAAQAAVEAPGWKAIEYRSDLSWKSLIWSAMDKLLIGMVLYFSHSRALRRIANGKAEQGDPAPHT